MHIIRLKQAGDTIVEVLIAIAVVSSVLAGAYVSSNKALQQSRQSQERGEALKYAEAQVEQLKDAAATVPSTFTVSGAFCYLAGARKSLAGTPAATADADVLTTAVYPNNCRQGTTTFYYTVIQRASDNSTFTITVRWDPVTTVFRRDEVRIVYRLHQ